ncbi:alkaline phosphatase D family protein [Citreimonas sp.]|uniref:alkaline phosphatase D family protein n=1 Tax=Citreimonas sp. TaxID=3036715 RepID=UPI0040591788
MTKMILSRRQALAGGVAASAMLAAPSLSRAQSRPVMAHGIMSGDVAHDGAMIWAHADREARMLVEWATTESMNNATRVPALNVGPATGHAGKLLLTGLPSDQEIFYRVRMEDLSDPSAVSEPLAGRFRTAPTGMRDIRFVWSGDTAGQGWGIDRDRGGMRTYATMLQHQPDFMIHSGDTVYADGPLKDEVVLEDGSTWRNLVTPAKRKVAETLDEFRGQHLYNYLDDHVRAFNAQVPILAQWDDHEVTNNWYPSEILEDDRYTEKNVALLAARGARAFHEMLPTRQPLEEPGRVYRKIAYGPLLDIFFLDMRSYRGDNSPNRQEDGAPFLGDAQLAWLKRELAASRATWKVIASDMPIGMMVRDGESNFENMANGDGPVLGREQDIADILSFIRAADIANTVWLTADVHYTAAHHYSPDRAVFQDFEPFWEFVSGPLHSGTFGPSDYDNTFGPEVRFAKHPEAGRANLPPSEGLQFFGLVDIDAATREMTVRLMDSGDTELWSTTLSPRMG